MSKGEDSGMFEDTGKEARRDREVRRVEYVVEKRDDNRGDINQSWEGMVLKRADEGIKRG